VTLMRRRSSLPAASRPSACTATALMWLGKTRRLKTYATGGSEGLPVPQEPGYGSKR